MIEAKSFPGWIFVRVYTENDALCMEIEDTGGGMSEMGEVTKKLYDTLTGIQMGRIEAPEGWIHVIE